MILPGSTESACVIAASSTCTKSYEYIANSGGWTTAWPSEFFTPTGSAP